MVGGRVTIGGGVTGWGRGVGATGGGGVGGRKLEVNMALSIDVSVFISIKSSGLRLSPLDQVWENVILGAEELKLFKIAFSSDEG